MRLDIRTRSATQLRVSLMILTQSRNNTICCCHAARIYETMENKAWFVALNWETPHGNCTKAQSSSGKFKDAFLFHLCIALAKKCPTSSLERSSGRIANPEMYQFRQRFAFDSDNTSCGPISFSRLRPVRICRNAEPWRGQMAKIASMR